MVVMCDVDADPASLFEFLGLNNVHAGVALDEINAIAATVYKTMF